MKWYRIKFKAKSWLSSEWQADTIWGHLCWGLKYLHGEHELTDFIAAYDSSQPPLFISNGFPGDLLPRPVLPSPALVSEKQFDRQKQAKKNLLLSPEEFNHVLRGEMVYPLPKPKARHRVTLKNQINRITNTTTAEEQSLYPFEEHYFNTISIYARIANGFEDRARELFQYLSKTGYGKRKSVGYGWLEMIQFEPFAGFVSPHDANAFISLSNFVPAKHDPAKGYWETLVKYGKLGEEYASSTNPFKKPLLMFTAGSVFYDSPVRDYYGRLIAGLSSEHPQVVQYGFALPVSIRLSGG
ncbi:MAG: hypothetical protein J7L19_04715 [Dehalococcoidia bacterium]|nr:hypothetical protein [Dehalococcoidia bacterium]